MYQYALGLYEKAFPDGHPLEEKLLLTRQLGYDFMELCVDLKPEREARLYWTIEQRRVLRNFLSDHGLRLKTLSLSALRRRPLGLLDDRANQEALDMLERGLELACDLGTQVMLINGYDVYDEPSTPETQARYARNLPLAAGLAARYGVMVGVENAEKAFMDSITKAARWVAEADSPYLQIYGDIGNTANAAAGDTDRAMADLEAGRGHLAAMHLKDTLPGEYRFTRYGEGHVDFARSIQKVKELGVHMFTAELFFQPCFDFQEEAARVNHFLRAYLDA